MKEINDCQMFQELARSSGYASQFSMDVLPESRLLSADSGDSIIKEGIRPDSLYYLCRGRAKLYLTHPNGKISFIDFLQAPCFIGEMELLDDTHEARAVQAISQCWLFSLPAASFRSQLLNDTVFLRNICLLLGSKNQRNIISASRNQSFPLANRLAAFLLLAQNHGFYREKHTAAAEYLGVSYRHLLYVLADFCKKGCLRKEGRGYRLTNEDVLLAMAREMEPEWPEHDR